jgi:hypothetical protein
MRNGAPKAAAPQTNEQQAAAIANSRSLPETMSEDDMLYLSCLVYRLFFRWESVFKYR